MREYKCLQCEAEIESDDNFCWKCGHWTARGYTFFHKDNIKIIEEGVIVKQDGRIALLIWTLFLFMMLNIGLCLYRGMDIVRPFYYIEKQICKYKYGYNVSIFKTDNQYYNKPVNSLEDAYEYINKDLEGQEFKCGNDFEVYRIQERLKSDFGITSVNFCDISLEESEKIANVIDRMYKLFPNVRGYLTNISITNASEKDEYVAYFQPIYQFVNSNASTNSYSKVNKTQILLNSYYFLNSDILNLNLTDKVQSGWYVKDANWESQIAHELGHYISFVTLLKTYNVEIVVYQNTYNEDKINEVIKIINSGEYSKSLLNKAYENYKYRYGFDGTLEEFALSISKYAGNKNKKGELIADETIAEAIHDYYLHGNNATLQSLEIVNEVKSRL